jgi:5,10-methenyltetrahydrofolate synthetase
MSDKAALRSILITARSALAIETRKQWNDAICKQIIAWWTQNQPKTIGVYWPIRGEPDLQPAYHDLAMRGVQLALPMVAGKNKPLSFLAWRPGDPLTKDAMGVSIPASPHIIAKTDALFIPCVGFNEAGFRLGYGGGFYDRTLSGSNRPLAIGVAYSCARADFDSEAHDIALNAIITEQSSFV